MSQVSGSLGVFGTGITQSVSAGANTAQQLLQALGGISDVVSGVVNLGVNIDTYQRGLAAQHEGDSWPDLELEVLDPANSEYLVPDGVELEAFADQILAGQAPAEDFHPAYRDEFMRRRRTNLIGTLASRSQSDQREQREVLLSHGVGSLLGTTDVAQFDTTVAQLSEDLGIDQTRIRTAASTAMLEYSARRGDGTGFAHAEQLAPPGARLAVEQQRQVLERRQTDLRRQEYDQAGEEVAGILLNVELGRGGATTGEARQRVLDLGLDASTTLSMLGQVERAELDQQQRLLRESAPEIYNELIAARLGGSTYDVVRGKIVTGNFTPEQQLRFLQVVDNEDRARQTRTLTDISSEILAMRFTGTDETAIREFIIASPEIEDPLKQRLIDSSFDRERREAGFQRAELDRNNANKHDIATQAVWGLVNQGNYDGAIGLIDVFLGNGFDQTQAFQIRQAVARTGQQRFEQDLRVAIRDGEIGLEEAISEVELALRRPPDDPRHMAIDRGDFILGQVVQVSTDQMRQARVDLIFNSALSPSTPDGQDPRPTVPILTSEDDNAINLSLAQRGIVSAVPGVGGGVVFNTIADPVRWAIHTRSVNRVTTDAARVISGDLNSDQADQVRRGAQSYGALLLHAPHLARSLDLSDIGALRARFIAARLGRRGGEVLVSNEALGAELEPIVAEAMALQPRSFDFDRDQVLGLAFGGDPNRRGRMSSTAEWVAFTQNEGREDIKRTLKKSEFWKGLGLAERFVPFFKVGISDIPTDIVNRYLGLLEEEHRFARSTIPNEAQASEIAEAWALDRLTAEFPPLIWNDVIYWTGQPNTTAHPNTAEAIRSEILRSPGGSEQLFTDLTSNYYPVWDDSQNGYTFVNRTTGTFKTYVTPEQTTDILVVSTAPTAAAQIVQQAEDAILKRGQRGLQRNPPPVLPVDEYNYHFGSGRYYTGEPTDEERQRFQQELIQSRIEAARQRGG